MLTLNDGRSELWQWDTGRKLTVDAECSQVHFSNKVFGRSIDVDVVDGIAIVPDILLQTDKDLTAWAFAGTAENGYTKISKVFKVNRRNKPADYVFTPPDQTTLGELKERLDKIEESQDPDAIKNAVEDYLEKNPVEAPVQSVNGKTGAVELTAEDVGAISQDDLQEATNKALTQAKESGEFDGPPGSPGLDYVLTEADKIEIAEMAANLVEIPDSDGNAVQYVEQELTPEQQAQARTNIQAAGADAVDAILEDVPLKNILPPDYVMGYWNGAEFAVTTAHSASANPISVTGGGKLYLTWSESTDAITNKICQVTYFNANNEMIKSQSSYFGPDVDSDTRKYFDIPESCTYLHFSLWKYSSGLRLADICLSYSDSHGYVPYEQPGRKAIKTSALNESVRNILSPLYGKTIVNFGDSIYGKRRPPDDISTELAKLTGATVYNCGFDGTHMSEHWTADYNALCMHSLADAIVSGDWSAQETAAQNIAPTSGALAYFTETYEILKNLDFSKVDVITIAHGTNDFNNNDLADNESNLKDIKTYAGALRYSIEKLLTAYPHLKIYICSPIYRFWAEDGTFVDDSDTHANGNGVKLTDFVEKAKSVASEYHLPYIDCYYSLGFNKFNREKYFKPTDGTHPITSGCRLIAAHMAKALL